MKYIDAEKLIAEIERRFSEYNHDSNHHIQAAECASILDFIDTLNTTTSLQQEPPEVDLEKFTERMDMWKARYNYPDNIPIKGTMAFTAKMFYQYPNVARQWYEQLPKVK